MAKPHFVYVLAQEQWNALMTIIDRIESRTNGGSIAAVLVAPQAALKYRRRTGRRIDDDSGVQDYQFDPAQVMLDLVRPQDIKFAADRGGDAEPFAVGELLEAQGLCGDGRTELTADQE